MKSLIVFILIAGLFQSLQCSLSERKVPCFLSLDSNFIKAQHERVKHDHDEKIVVIQRQMSRAYVTLMDELQNLKMKTNPENEEFLSLCLKISEYKEKHLDLLQQNKLLYDDGHDHCDNHFNSDLLAQLQDIAVMHDFDRKDIPSPVRQVEKVKKINSVSEAEL
jgi:hypothetical protein